VPVPVPVHASMSSFITDDVIATGHASHAEAQELLEISFCATVRMGHARRRRTSPAARADRRLWWRSQGRASHAYQLMCLFPSFAKKYQRLYETLLYAEGPLPYDWRVYLAIMVRGGPGRQW
jgi:hypothetical protein